MKNPLWGEGRALIEGLSGLLLGELFAQHLLEPVLVGDAIAYALHLSKFVHQRGRIGAASRDDGSEGGHLVGRSFLTQAHPVVLLARHVFTQQTLKLAERAPAMVQTGCDDLLDH